MKKTVLYSVIALVLVLGLILPMAVSVMASDIAGNKVRNPDQAPYEVGETIYYVMNVTNQGTTENNILTRIWDTLPSGTVIEFLGTSETLVQTPGQTDSFNASYIVQAGDFEWIVPIGDPYWGVRNVFQAAGNDTQGVPVELLVEDIAEVIPPPPVGGEAFPISKLSVLVPWIALGAAIIAGAAMFVRRRKARS